jgi:predicted Holliday junction resolvase-like endonuclease
LTEGQKKKAKELKEQKVQEFLKKAEEKALKKKEEEKQRIRDAEIKAAEYVKKKAQKGLLQQEVIDLAPSEVAESITAGREVVFEPFPKQIQFLSSDEDHVLFGGGKGSGKTNAFIFDPLRNIEHPKFRALIIRRSLKDLRDLINKSQDLYRRLIPGVRWKEKEQMFVFPSGARIEYGYLDSFADVDNYWGQEYSYIGIDEISQIPEQEWVDKLLGSLRQTSPDLKCYFRATTNWTGIGIEWVKVFFGVETHEQNTTIIHKGEVELPTGEIDKVITTKKWFNSLIWDNPIKAQDKSYIAWLSSLPEYQKRAWLYGETSVAEGIAFPDFDRKIHVIEPIEIPKNWKRYSGTDYGYNDGASCVFIAVPPDGPIHIYRDYSCNKKADKGKHYTAQEFAEKVLGIEEEAQEIIRRRIIDGSVYDKRGATQPSLYEEMRAVGFRAIPADQTRGSRTAGKNKIHELLRVNPKTGKPGIVVFNNCQNVIKMFLSLPLDEHNMEDVDTDSPHDCEYDALRYVLMSRPSSRPKLVGDNRPIQYKWSS